MIKANNVRAVKCTSKTSECQVDIFAIEVDSLDNIQVAGPDGSKDGLVTQPHVSVCGDGTDFQSCVTDEAMCG